jgi:ribosome-binding factor A
VGKLPVLDRHYSHFNTRQPNLLLLRVTFYTGYKRREMDQHRAERVSEALREELGEMISYELSDPRIGEAVVTEVLVSPDKKHAQVRLHMDKDPAAQQQTLLALEGARHFLKRQIALRLNLFRVPELHFEADVERAAAAKMSDLLKRVRRGRPRDQAQPPT